MFQLVLVVIVSAAPPSPSRNLGSGAKDGGASTNASVERISFAEAHSGCRDGKPSRKLVRPVALLRVPGRNNSPTPKRSTRAQSSTKARQSQMHEQLTLYGS